MSAAKLDPRLCRRHAHDLRANKLGGDLVQWIDRRYLPNDDDTADRVAREIRDDIDGGRCEPLDTFEGPASEIADQLTAAAELAERIEARIHHLAHVGDCKVCGDRAQDLRDVVDADGAADPPALTADEVRAVVRAALHDAVMAPQDGRLDVALDAIADRVAEKLAGRVVAGIGRERAAILDQALVYWDRDLTAPHAQIAEIRKLIGGRTC